jgi:serine protease Do
MFNRNLLPSFLIGTAIVIASPAFARQALLPTDVAQIAKSTVVRIEPTINSPGSGVIIGRYQEGRNNVYVVLTANHVVQYKDDEYYIITPATNTRSGKRRLKIKISTEKDIQKLPGVDLSVVRFRSQNDFQTATLGDSQFTTEGAGIYVAGFPNPGAAIKQRVFQFTSSLVSSRLDGESVEDETSPVENGYAISYTANTRAGMSGGPVFDVSGRVVGIHGQGDREEVAPRTESPEGNQESGAPRTAGDKTGFNLGIPIQTFLSKASGNITKFNLKIDNTEPGLFSTIVAQRGNNRVPPPTNIEEKEEATAEENKQEPASTAPQTVAPSKPSPRNIPSPNRPNRLNTAPNQSLF